MWTLPHGTYVRSPPYRSHALSNARLRPASECATAKIDARPPSPRTPLSAPTGHGAEQPAVARIHTNIVGVRWDSARSEQAATTLAVCRLRSLSRRPRPPSRLHNILASPMARHSLSPIQTACFFYFRALDSIHAHAEFGGSYPPMLTSSLNSPLLRRLPPNARSAGLANRWSRRPIRRLPPCAPRNGIVARRYPPIGMQEPAANLPTTLTTKMAMG